jgi:hypothetical protein
MGWVIVMYLTIAETKRIVTIVYKDNIQRPSARGGKCFTIHIVFDSSKVMRCHKIKNFHTSIQ